MRIANQWLMMYITVGIHTNDFILSNCWFNAVSTFVYIDFSASIQVA